MMIDKITDKALSKMISDHINLGHYKIGAKYTSIMIRLDIVYGIRCRANRGMFDIEFTQFMNNMATCRFFHNSNTAIHRISRNTDLTNPLSATREEFYNFMASYDSIAEWLLWNQI
jgi:hypothetical protein